MKNVILPIAIVIIACAAYFSYQHFSQERFACSYPPFTRIENGMTADQITDSLGDPDKKVVKDELGGNRFGQGERELQIKSGWIYDLPDWDGGLEIYFDSQNNVIGKNCGHG